MSVVENEHSRLSKMSAKYAHEAGLWRGSHARLRKAIEKAVSMIRELPLHNEHPRQVLPIDLLPLEKMLTETLALDDEVSRDIKRAGY